MPHDTGNLQNESTFVDTSKSKQGKVSLVSSTPYARQLVFSPQSIIFKSMRMLLRAVNGTNPGLMGYLLIFVGKHIKRFIRG